MSRLLSELAATGTRIAATSNTPPNALGEGRFAAQDFLREIDSLAAQFTTMRIDGLDYRRRDVEAHAVTCRGRPRSGAAALRHDTLDNFDALLAHLATVHPSRYVKLVDGLDAIGLTDVHELQNQTDALRFVAFVDRLYDAQVRMRPSGTPLDQVFAGRHARGRLPQEVPSRDLAAHRSDVGRRRSSAPVRYRASCSRRSAVTCRRCTIGEHGSGEHRERHLGRDTSGVPSNASSFMSSDTVKPMPPSPATARGRRGACVG